MKPTVLKEVAAKQSPLSGFKTLSERARQHIENGAVTSGYAADRENVIRMLNEALATELVCVLRCQRHYFMAAGIRAAPVAAEFLEHASRKCRMPTSSPSALSSSAASRIFHRTGWRRAAMRNTSRAIRSRA